MLSKNKKMKLREIMDYIFCNVVIYQKTDDDTDPYKDLYQGNCREIPEDLLDREVWIIAGREERELDICVNNADERKAR